LYDNFSLADKNEQNLTESAKRINSWQLIINLSLVLTKEQFKKSNRGRPNLSPI